MHTVDVQKPACLEDEQQTYRIRDYLDKKHFVFQELTDSKPEFEQKYKASTPFSQREDSSIMRSKQTTLKSPLRFNQNIPGRIDRTL
jgi:hypothetical protein